MQMKIRSVLIFTFMVFSLCSLCSAPARAAQERFSMDWQFAVDLPEADSAGLLKGKISHLKNTSFRFTGEYLSKKSPVKTGPVSLSTVFTLGDGKLYFNNLEIRISRLEINIPDLGITNPNITINGKGIIDLDSESVSIDGLNLIIDDFPQINGSLEYSVNENGFLALNINNPLPLLQKIASDFLENFNRWDKEGNFSVNITAKSLTNNPEISTELVFDKVSAASPDGSVLLDSIKGSLNATFPADLSRVKGRVSIEKGESLYDTFYMDFSGHPLNILIESTLPVESEHVEGFIQMDWRKIGKLHAEGKIKNVLTIPEFNLNADLNIDDLKAPFRLFAVDPFSLDGVSANGQTEINCKVKSVTDGMILTGTATVNKADFNSDLLSLSSLNSRLPFAIKLNKNFQPETSPGLQNPEQGFVEMEELRSGPVEIKRLTFPVTISSNEISFGKIPAIGLQGGQIELDDMSIKNPFSEEFVFHGKLNAEEIDLLPLSPAALPVEGKMNGDLEFWLLMNHLSTTGSLQGQVYGGQMVISEIYAENLFEDSRQYGADFKIRHLDLVPLSKALDIGLITGHMDLDLTDLVIAYNQPAGFYLRAVTTPDSDSDRNISLKAVNTLSVIGTGSGLTGAGVGVFSQFFKEFGYSELGLECRLDNDIFKIRGLIREEGIEYIIKRPPLFGINVVNSNPENLISFSDMLKRLKRVIGN